MAEELNFDEEIVKLLDADPFVPFVIIVASGDRYEVNDPHRVAIGGILIVVVEPREGICTLRKSQVVSVEQRQSAA
jgi:hypothetical protein